MDSKFENVEVAKFKCAYWTRQDSLSSEFVLMLLTTLGAYCIVLILLHETLGIFVSCNSINLNIFYGC